jgi:hypothetical protein
VSTARPPVPLREEGPSDTASQRYQETIAKAKQRRQPVEAVASMPRFDRQAIPDDVAPTGPTLSKKTLDGLESLATQMRAESQNVAEDEEDAPPPPPPPPPKSPEERMREAVESRCEPLDISSYLMSGEMSQTVPIVPGKLFVTFRTVTDQEEVYVDSKLAGLKDATERQFLRSMNEWSLIFFVHSLNGEAWPSVFDKSGGISEKAIELRTRRVQQLPSSIFNLISQNLEWFLDRVAKALTLEALGNG